MALFSLSLGGVVGLVAGAAFPWLFFLALFILGPVLAFFLRRRRGLFLAALAVMALGLGGLRVKALPPPGEGLAPFLGREVDLVGTVLDDPQPADGLLVVRLRVEKVNDEEARGEMEAILPPPVELGYGDRLRLKGRLEEESPLLFRPQVELQERGKGFLPWLHHLRLRLSGALARALPEPQASLSQGVLLGLRGSIPGDLRDAFSRTGTAHILAISGLNVGILAGILLSFFAWALGRKRPAYLVLAFLGIWLYIFLSGLMPPAVRAGVMGSIFLMAEGLGRQRSGLVALAFAAALMAGLRPSLLGEVSFQLSFLAMAGLAVLAPPFQALGRRTALPGSLVDGVAYSLGAILATWPLVAHYFGIVSLVGLPATLLTLPSLGGIIISSALVAGLGLLFSPLGYALGWAAWLFTSYLLVVVELFYRLPLAYYRVEFTPALVWAYYLGLGLLLSGAGMGRRSLALLRERFPPFWERLPRRGLLLSLFFLSALVWSAVLSLPDQKLRVSFLDVGQGSAVLIQKGSVQVLVDGGPSPGKLNQALGQALPFWDRKIEAVILTHPHSDHLTGLLEALKRYEVDTVLDPELEPAPALYQEWRRLLEEKGVPLLRARAGQELRLGEVRLKVLNPQEELLEKTGRDLDNNSVVLRLEAGRVSFLLPADIFGEGELELLARGAPLESTVLQVGHHGSAGSTSPSFLDAVRPLVAVISREEREDYAEPVVMARLEASVGENLYFTSRQGTIVFTTDGQRLWVRKSR
ncbi:MAG TPA: ComEC/Rec2 family competence protein [Dehalococcoidia bacterium]|nr:ComEC/Rec2 family competence protein [Dehalococcoidia bacterium]